MQQLSQKDKEIIAARVAVRLNRETNVSVVYNGVGGSPPYDIHYVEIVSPLSKFEGLGMVLLDIKEAASANVSAGSLIDIGGSVYVVTETKNLIATMRCNLQLANAV